MIEKPQIVVDGKARTIRKVYAKDWRELFKFDGERQELILVDFVDKHCEIIANLFDDITVEELQENFTVEEIMILYKDILKYFLQLLSSKSGGDEKNATDAGEADQS